MKKPFPIIGLEIHVELKTKSKMFCQCSADYFGQKPNSHVCPVCLGMPGALPVPNHQAVEWTIKIAKALNCTVKNTSKFDRKHYFYPDLPKGYQISQYDEPIGVNGYLEISHDGKETKKFRLRRVHLEEDTGKLIHAGKETLIDFNRSSVPLVEIVTEADFHNSEDVKRFLEELQVIIRYLDVANADMEKGDMRLEPNISVLFLEEGQEWDGKTYPKYKVEVKNINSFRFAKAAIDYELGRQAEILESGETPIQETRGFNEAGNNTVSQRVKEEAADYRYFPEPDIPTMRFTDEYLKELEDSLPEMPSERLKKFMEEYNIRYADAFLLTRAKWSADALEGLLTSINKHPNYSKKDWGQRAANDIINKFGIEKIKTVSKEDLEKRFLQSIEGKKTDMAELQKAIEELVKQHPTAVQDYKSGKENVLMFLVGQTMKAMKGQADANIVKETLKSYLQK